MISYYT